MKSTGLALVLLLAALQAHAQERPQAIPPILDVHVHANHASFAGPPPRKYCYHVTERPVPQDARNWLEMMDQSPCEHTLLSPMTDEEVMSQTLALMKRRNVIAVTSGRLVKQWQAAAPDRIIPSLIHRGGPDVPSVDEMRASFKSGDYRVLGEIEAQYEGIPPDDPSLAPYWAMAEELDVPVGIHIGPGPPGAPYIAWPNYRARLYSPLRMEEILIRHPRLRVYIMHAAWPMRDELLALMWAHPQVHVDISGIIVDLPRPAFYSYLQPIMEAGFGKRVLFGSDSMIWPGLMEVAIRTVEEAPFLSEPQKRDILYDNAARFLRLTPEEIARHKALGAPPVR